jgi:predicted SprT family Zn-dependent metalloprotease
MLTHEQLQAWWRELNNRYFADALFPIPILWSRRLTSSVGLFLNRVGPRTSLSSLDSFSEHRLIRLSIPLLSNQPDDEVRNTLAHEMIHQWQYDVRKRRPDHGDEFHRIMATMNRAGLLITVRHSLTEDVAALSRYTWQCLRCGRIYYRHHRSIKPNRHRCGSCAGPLKELPSRDGSRCN